MKTSISKSALSPARARLLELLQSLNFGRVEGLKVHGGEPIFDPPPRVIQTLKLGADNGPRPERSYSDFRLKHQTVEMLNLLSSLGHGEVRSIEVRFGLPNGMEIERSSDYSGEASASGATRRGCTIYNDEEPGCHRVGEEEGGAR